VDGKPLEEPYATYIDSPLASALDRDRHGPVTVPPGKLFMLGDNRDQSMDSRVWGYLDVTKVKGKAFIVYFSVRSQDIPHQSALGSIAYVLTHPSLVRWDRLGDLVH
jgi:signal peptidase I